jgi:hypothetical protein
MHIRSVVAALRETCSFGTTRYREDDSMGRRLVLTLGVLVSGLLAASAMAADGGDTSAAPLPQGDERAATQADGATVEAGTVPQARIDVFKKREEARKRLDEALKVRAQMIEAGQ